MRSSPPRTELSPRPPKSTPATSRDRRDPIEQRTADAHSSPFRSPAHKIQRQKDHAGETTSHHRAERGSVCWTVHPGTTLLRDRSRNGNPNPRLRRNRTRQERNMIMEPLMATAAEATDMLRVGRSAVYRLIAARQRELIKI